MGFYSGFWLFCSSYSRTWASTVASGCSVPPTVGHGLLQWLLAVLFLLQSVMGFYSGFWLFCSSYSRSWASTVASGCSVPPTVGHGLLQWLLAVLFLLQS